jgi:endonuclease/exonuclease/phosphatase family metal-dependent hydrolase
MKNIISIFLLFSCFLVKATTISVVTYNVNYHFINKDIVNILDSIDADIVCLQETNAEWETIIKNGLSRKYPFIDFKHRGISGGFATLSKYPIIKNEYIKNKVGWFSAWSIIIKKKQDSIQILNTHLKPPLTRKGLIGWNAYFKASEVHIKELESFSNELTPNLPTIVLGDFNENDKGKTMKWLKTKGFNDALSQFDKRSKTWRFVLLRGRYDHLVYNNKLNCINAKVYKLGKSDHFPVLGVFEIKAKEN